jgi:hypothetical protein
MATYDSSATAAESQDSPGLGNVPLLSSKLSLPLDHPCELPNKLK